MRRYVQQIHVFIAFASDIERASYLLAVALMGAHAIGRGSAAVRSSTQFET